MRIIGDLGSYCLTSQGLSEGPCPYPDLERKDLGYGVFQFIYGPSAGGLLESTAFNISTFGESIDDISNLSYKGRSLQISGRSVQEALLLVERINGPFSASHAISFLTAIERGTESEVPSQVVHSRIAQLELERIRNNLLVIQRVLESASFLVPSYLLLQQIEEVNRAISKSCGHRYFFGANYFGGSRCELVLPKLNLKDINEITGNRIFIDRLQGNGIIKADYAIGPAARGAGFAYDARAEVDELGYKNFGFKIQTEKDGDAFSRISVRLKEIEESYEILKELLGKVKPYSYSVKLGDGKGIGRVESPSGDLAYLVEVSNGKLNKAYLFPPSKVNMRLFLQSMTGNIFTDFPFNWESFGIWISELEVDLK